MSDEAAVVSSYSRAQALEDGVLVDVTRMAKEAGFKVQVAQFHRRYHDCGLKLDTGFNGKHSTTFAREAKLRNFGLLPYKELEEREVFKDLKEAA